MTVIHAKNGEKKKPAVVVLAASVSSQASILEPILSGLEEEGIPARVMETEDKKAEDLAKEAAKQSPLNVGIGISKKEERVVLHHRDLPTGKPLLILKGGQRDTNSLRSLGANAARLVKGDPLLFQNYGDGHQERNQPVELTPAQFEELISRIVREILNKNR